MRVTANSSVQKLLEAHEEQNSEAFTEAVSLTLSLISLLLGKKSAYVKCYLTLFQVKEFDSISRLDQWQTTMLLRIKKTIQGDSGDLKWIAINTIAHFSAHFSVFLWQSSWTLL